MGEYLSEDYRGGKRPPKFCPLCGRELEEWSWTVGTTEWPSLVCYGGKGALSKWFDRRMSVVRAVGAHYEAKIEARELRRDISEEKPYRFDPYTGQQEAE